MKDRFIRSDTVSKPDGASMTVEEYGKMLFGDGDIEMYRNSTYQVLVRQLQHKDPEAPPMVWLSIKRNDREPIHDWRDLQDIKNELVGRYCEGVEIYPAESRRVDTANQYHLWVWTDPKFRIPFGMTTRVVTDDDSDYAKGSKQRPLDISWISRKINRWKLNWLLKRAKSRVGKLKSRNAKDIKDK